MKQLSVAVLTIGLLLSTGCAKKTTGGGTPAPPSATVQSSARDAAAAINGVLTSAQAKYTTACESDPGQTPCTLIKKGVTAQNLLITALDTYCGWSATTAPLDPSAACIPVASASQTLVNATSNVETLITEIGGLL